MKRIFFQGSFDILNACHVQCLQDILHTSGMDSELIIGLNTDELIQSYKKRKAIIPYKQREMILRSLRMVSNVVPCNDFSCMEQLREIRPNVFIVGEDWVGKHPEEEAFVRSYGGEIANTRFYSHLLHSTDIRNRIMANDRL